MGNVAISGEHRNLSVGTIRDSQQVPWNARLYSILPAELGFHINPWRLSSKFFHPSVIYWQWVLRCLKAPKLLSSIKKLVISFFGDFRHTKRVVKLDKKKCIFSSRSLRTNRSQTQKVASSKLGQAHEGLFDEIGGVGPVFVMQQACGGILELGFLIGFLVMSCSGYI